MSWGRYVTEHSRGEVNRLIAAKVDVTESNVSRWKSGQTKAPAADAVARFARAYGRPVLEAFIAAGFLTEAEAGAKPEAPAGPVLNSLTDEQLLDEVRARMRHDTPTSHARESRAQDDYRIAAHPMKGGQSQGRQIRQNLDRLGEESQETGAEGWTDD